VPALMFLLVQSPVWMVKAGGVAQASTLPVLAVAALFLRYRRLPREAATGFWLTAVLWIACAVICAVMMYYFVLLL